MKSDKKKKEYDKRRYLEYQAGKLGLDLDDPDLEAKVYRQKPSVTRQEVGKIGAERNYEKSQRWFDRYYKVCCMKGIGNCNMKEWERYEKKKQQT